MLWKKRNKPKETTKNCNDKHNTSKRYSLSLFHVICGCVNWSAFLMLCSIWGLNCVRMFSRQTLRRQTIAYIEKDLLNNTQTCNEHILNIFRAFSLYRLVVVVVVVAIFSLLFRLPFMLLPVIQPSWVEFCQMHSNIFCYWTGLVTVLKSCFSNIIFRSYWYRCTKASTKIFGFTLKSNLASNAFKVLDTNVVLSCWPQTNNNSKSNRKENHFPRN